MMAPVAAKPELPKNLRRLKSSVLPFANPARFPAPLYFSPVPAPGLFLPGFPPENRRASICVLRDCRKTALSCGHGIATRDVATNTRSSGRRTNIASAALCIGFAVHDVLIGT